MPRRFFAVVGETFVPLTEWLATVSPDALPPEYTFESECAAVAPGVACIEEESLDPLSELCSSVRRFRAALEDAIEAIRVDLIADIAAEIVGRELQLAPVEIDSIIARAVARYGDEPPLAIRAHPNDAERLSREMPIVADRTLRSGDVVLELRTGSIDARLGLRLERLLHVYR